MPPASRGDFTGLTGQCLSELTSFFFSGGLAREGKQMLIGTDVHHILNQGGGRGDFFADDILREHFQFFGSGIYDGDGA